MIEDGKYLITYFDRQSDYYVEKYKAHNAGTKITFNIGAFLGGAGWFLYRKLYVHALVITLILLLSGVIEDLIYNVYSVDSEVQKAASITITLITSIIYGYAGNFFYLQQADTRMKRILENTNNEDERIKLLKAKGGVTWWSVIIGLLAIIILMTLANFA